MRALLRDRRGVGVAEYALLLFILVVVGALTFKVVGGRVKHAGNKTEQEFAHAASSGGGSGQGGSESAGGAAGGGAKTTANAGGGGGSGGGGAAGAGSAGGGSSAAASSGAHPEDEEIDTKTPLWKIAGAIFLVLFAIGGYFAFRKKAKGG